MNYSSFYYFILGDRLRDDILEADNTMGNVLLCTATRLLGLVEDPFRSLLAARQRNDEARQRSEELRQTQFEQREQQQHEESRRQSAHLNKMVESLQETVVLQ